MMNKEDREFLKALQHEMLTQDKVCQASPRFWVVMQTVRDYWVDDNIDGLFVYEDGYDCVFEEKGHSWTELSEWLGELDGVTDCQTSFCGVELSYGGEELLIDDVSSLKTFLDEHSPDKYSVGEFRERQEICPNTFFLTLRECKEHIARNHYHYKNPHPYAMTAWRSPQAERLFKILEQTDWDGV